MRRGEYKIKKKNIEKLKTFLKKIKDGKHNRMGTGAHK